MMPTQAQKCPRWRTGNTKQADGKCVVLNMAVKSTYNIKFTLNTEVSQSVSDKETQRSINTVRGASPQTQTPLLKAVT
jgi:hypothetical protein